MGNFIRLYFAVAVVLLSGLAIAAEDDSELTVVPGIDLAFKQSSLNLILKGVAQDNAIKPNYTTIIPSLLVAHGKLYGMLSYDTPLTEYHETIREQKVGEFQYSDRSYLRQESTVTMGYRVLPVLGLFAGFIKGETYIRANDVKYNGTTSTPEPNDISFVMRGYFTGLSSSRSFEGKGTLAISAAYTKLDGVFTRGDQKGNVETFYSQSASGYSTSLSWTGQMNGSMFYQVGLRYSRYLYDFGVGILQIDEPVKGLSFGVRNYF